MDAVTPQLSNLAAAGCYRAGCSADALCEATRQAGFALFEVECKGLKGKQHVLSAWAAATGFSGEFGANWDALVDVLCDLSWTAAEGYVLILRNVSTTLGLSSNDREIMQDILDDTVVYWRQRNKPFWVFFA